jgi:Rrf2 family protein
MKISTKSRYGLKACYELAVKRSEGPVALTGLVEATGTTLNYLEQIMILLKKAEIVKADRGVQGGYYLAKDPSDVSVGEILRALEDGLKLVDCIHSECNAQPLCPTHDVWCKMYDSLNNMLDSYTLKDMIDHTEAK